MVAACFARYGRVDILVNNVGGSAAGGAVQLSEQAWDRQLDFNLKSVFLSCKYVIPEMEKIGGGAIVNTASTSGQRWTGAAQVAYASTKAAVIQFSRVTAVGIRQEEHSREHGCAGPDAHADGGDAFGRCNAWSAASRVLASSPAYDTYLFAPPSSSGQLFADVKRPAATLMAALARLQALSQSSLTYFK